MSDFEARFSSLTLADLERYIEVGQEENLHLEFKTLNGPGFRSQDDRRNLARALSGFANSDGGLVVWGVLAQKSAESPDCAKELRPVPDVASLLPRLNELTSDSLSPVHSGVQHRVIHTNEDKSGFAVSLVPASDSGPHMAKLGVDQYFKRSGDSFVKMEHFDIADMFGRRPHPELSLRLTVKGDGGRSSAGVKSIKFRVVGVIQNSGRGSAVAPYLSVKVHKPYTMSQYGVDGNGSTGLPRVGSSDSTYRFGASASVMLHPGTAIEVFGIQSEYEIGHPDIKDLVIDYKMNASDIPLQGGRITLAADEIAATLRDYSSLTRGST